MWATDFFYCEKSVCLFSFQILLVIIEAIDTDPSNLCSAFRNLIIQKCFYLCEQYDFQELEQKRVFSVEVHAVPCLLSRGSMLK